MTSCLFAVPPCSLCFRELREDAPPPQTKWLQPFDHLCYGEENAQAEIRRPCFHLHGWYYVWQSFYSPSFPLAPYSVSVHEVPEVCPSIPLSLRVHIESRLWHFQIIAERSWPRTHCEANWVCGLPWKATALIGRAAARQIAKRVHHWGRTLRSSYCPATCVVVSEVRSCTWISWNVDVACEVLLDKVNEIAAWVNSWARDTIASETLRLYVNWLALPSLERR